MIYTVDLQSGDNGLEIVCDYFNLDITIHYVTILYLAHRFSHISNKEVVVEDIIEESMRNAKVSIMSGGRFCLNNLHRWEL